MQEVAGLGSARESSSFPPQLPHPMSNPAPPAFPRRHPTLVPGFRTHAYAHPRIPRQFGWFAEGTHWRPRWHCLDCSCWSHTRMCHYPVSPLHPWLVGLYNAQACHRCRAPHGADAESACLPSQRGRTTRLIPYSSRQHARRAHCDCGVVERSAGAFRHLFAPLTAPRHRVSGAAALALAGHGMTHPARVLSS